MITLIMTVKAHSHRLTVEQAEAQTDEAIVKAIKMATEPIAAVGSIQ